jgi:glycosyltransferase involved in cell wall biosynthesis
MMPERLDILSLVWYKVLPARFGGQKGIADFNLHLSEWHRITCLCSSDNEAGQVPYTVLPVLPVGRGQVLSPWVWLRVLTEIRRRRCTHMVVEHCYHGVTALLAKRWLGTRIILHEHNIEYERFRRMGHRGWSLLRLLERMACRTADLILFKTAADRDHACQAFGIATAKCMVVPFGIRRDASRTDAEHRSSRTQILSELGLSDDTRLLLFTGTLDYAPNADALVRLVRDALPMLRAGTAEPFKLLVCGRIEDTAFNYLKTLSDPDYRFLGYVDDIGRYLAGCDLLLNPVDSGGGIKVKNMEAISWGLPVVTMRHSAEGIEVDPASGILRAAPDGDVDTFCRLVIEALREGGHTPANFHARYHWRNIARGVAERVASL